MALEDREKLTITALSILTVLGPVSPSQHSLTVSTTTSRVASGLLRIAADFGLMTGTLVREFTSYHLPDQSLLYLLHAMSDGEPNAQRLIESPGWHMYLMDAADIERQPVSYSRGSVLSRAGFPVH